MNDMDIIESKRKTFNPDEVPEFYGLTERVNDSLIDMVKKGVIKYGEKGELAGKIRLDLQKTYPYYALKQKEDELTAFTLKSVMDDWRERHTGRSSFFNLNLMLGISDKKLFKNFVNSSECARETVDLENTKDTAWDKYLEQSHKVDEIKRTIEKNMKGLTDLSSADLKQKKLEYLDRWAIKNKLSGRDIQSIRSVYTKGTHTSKEDLMKKFRCDFMQEEYPNYLREEYRQHLTPTMCKTSELAEKIVDSEVMKNPDYAKESEFEKELHNEYEKADDRYSNHKYSGFCKEELDQIKKETKDFSDWMSKEIVKNLWRE